MRTWTKDHYIIDEVNFILFKHVCKNLRCSYIVHYVENAMLFKKNNDVIYESQAVSPDHAFWSWPTENFQDATMALTFYFFYSTWNGMMKQKILISTHKMLSDMFPETLILHTVVETTTPAIHTLNLLIKHDLCYLFVIKFCCYFNIFF